MKNIPANKPEIHVFWSVHFSLVRKSTWEAISEGFLLAWRQRTLMASVTELWGPGYMSSTIRTGLSTSPDIFTYAPARRPRILDSKPNSPTHSLIACWTCLPLSTQLIELFSFTIDHKKIFWPSWLGLSFYPPFQPQMHLQASLRACCLYTWLTPYCRCWSSLASLQEEL